MGNSQLAGAVNGKLAPVVSEKRIVSLDVLRGIAVLGILIMNIQTFAMVGAAYQNPFVWGDFTGINKLVWVLSHIFASGKFIAIFSMLFGAGVILITRKAEEKKRSGGKLHLRRNLWLGLFGLVHGYLLWHGDILFLYGLCSLPIYFMRNVAPKKLLITGLILLFICSGISVVTGFTMDFWSQDELDALELSWESNDKLIEEESGYSRGNWADLVVFRMPVTFNMQTSDLFFYTGWLVAGFMFIGMALFKWGVFTCERPLSFYKKGFLISFPLGAALVAWGVYENFEEAFSFDYSMFLGSQFNHWGAVVMSFSYICLVMLVCKAGSLKFITSVFQNIGRMALSNYLLQTMICVAIFYGGPGFGMFGKFERWEQLLIAVAIWVFLTIFSVIWMRKFRFGPFEWLWRTLTYWKVQPLKK